VPRAKLVYALCAAFFCRELPSDTCLLSQLVVVKALVQRHSDLLLNQLG